jgi:Domain of unknown function (DUF4926)
MPISFEVSGFGHCSDAGFALCNMIDNRANKTTMPEIQELGTVALLAGIPDENLARGQVGTVVDLPGNGTALVEFSDDDGKVYEPRAA